MNSGTSGDGLDIALVKFDTGKPELIKSKTYKYPEALTQKIITYGEPEFDSGVKWLELDFELGQYMGKSATKFINLLNRNNYKADVIASHGQTIRHLPNYKSANITYQVGDPSLIALQTGLPVIYDFRKADIAAGGEGAPLSPYLHQYLFSKRNKSIVVINLGGIANITCLPSRKSRKKPLASDIGPGNMIIDACMKSLYKKPYDFNGKIALSGDINNKIVSRLLNKSFFKTPPPKSTGREMFGKLCTDIILTKMKNDKPEDIIATISEITVKSISRFIDKYATDVSSVYLCGGGSKNGFIKNRLRELLPGTTISDTNELGYSPDYLEAMLWAYLGYLFIKGRPVNGSMFTGAKKKYIPGRLCLS
jgi:anhydro-N-acetylmuramic acid kinase